MLVRYRTDVSNYKAGMAEIARTTRNSQKDLRLWAAENRVAVNSTKYFAQQLKANKTALSGLSQQINSTQGRLVEASRVYGENSTQAKKYEDALRDLKIRHAELNNVIKDSESKVKKFENAMSNIQNKLKSAGASLTNAGRSMTLGVTAPLIAGATAVTKIASDAVENENLFTVSMGNMEESARNWSKEMKASLGVSEYGARKNIATFNVMLGSMGLSEKGAYDMSKGLAQLTYDMASFYNLKPEIAFEKLQSGISGEVEPLKRLGIVVNETTIKQFALKNGLIKSGQQMSETQKIIARYGAILEATSKAQGDLGRTIDSPTNRLRILKEQANDTAIEFGMTLQDAYVQLLVAAKPLLENLKQLVAWFKLLPKETRENYIKLAGLAVIIGPLTMGIGQLVGGLGNIAGALKIIPQLASLAGIGLAGLAPVAAVIAGAGITAIAIIEHAKKVEAQKKINDAPDASKMTPGQVVANQWANGQVTRYNQLSKKGNLTAKELTEMNNLKKAIDLRANAKPFGSVSKTTKTDAEAIQDQVKSEMTKAMDDYKKLMGDFSKYEDKNTDKQKKQLEEQKKIFEQKKSLLKEQVDSIKSQTAAFVNYTNIFDAIPEKQKVSADRLMNRLKAQVKDMQDWKKNLDVLRNKGINKDLLAELVSMGPGAGANLSALNKMSASQLKEYQNLYGQKYQIAGTQSGLLNTLNKDKANIIDKQINLSITGNNISTEKDVERVANQIISKLKLAGLKI